MQSSVKASYSSMNLKKKKKRPQFKILTDREITSNFGGTTKLKYSDIFTYNFPSA